MSIIGQPSSLTGLSQSEKSSAEIVFGYAAYKLSLSWCDWDRSEDIKTLMTFIIITQFLVEMYQPSPSCGVLTWRATDKSHSLQRTKSFLQDESEHVIVKLRRGIDKNGHFEGLTNLDPI